MPVQAEVALRALPEGLPGGLVDRGEQLCGEAFHAIALRLSMRAAPAAPIPMGERRRPRQPEYQEAAYRTKPHFSVGMTRID